MESVLLKGRRVIYKWILLVAEGLMAAALLVACQPQQSPPPVASPGSTELPLPVASPSATALPLPTASQAPTLAPASTPAPAFTVVSTPAANAENTQVTPVMNEVPIPTPLDPAMEQVVAQAKNDLAQRLAIDVGQIELVEVATVTWPDGSLGCPQPGMMYTQVQVDGLLIRFRAGGRIYEYHGGGARAPFLCQ